MSHETSNHKDRPDIQTVHPGGGSRETRCVICAALITLAACALFAGGRISDSYAKSVEPWQINAFEDLNPVEMGTFNALRTAALDINDIHDEEVRWMKVSELERLFIQPFARDAAWRKAGRIRWRSRTLPSETTHTALYLGSPEEADKTGQFLLVMLHSHEKKQGNAGTGPEHAPFEVWYRPAGSSEFPQIITDNALIALGWKEVVALRGEDEVRRVKGTM